MQIMAARSLTLPALTGVFNAGFSEYVVPIQMTETALSEHLDVNDIDLGCSRVLADPDPVSFALIARRDDEAWVGGMGTAPAYRGRGLGEQVLRAGIRAAAERGCEAVWLEVIQSNRPAVALYEKLGFEHVRDLIVWSLPASASGIAPPGVREVELARAHGWIVAHRATREPWQRSGAALARQADRGDGLRGWAIDRGSDVVAAVIVRERDSTAAVVQIAALDDAATADALGAAMTGYDDLRLANASPDDSASRALLLCMGAARIAAAGGWPLTLTVDDAVAFARVLSGATVIPVHFEGWEHLSEGRDAVERAFADASLGDRLRWPTLGVPT